MQAATNTTMEGMTAVADFLYGNWDKLLYSIIIIVIAFILIRVLGAVITKLGKEKGLAPGTMHILNSAVKYGIIFFALVNIIGVFSFTYIYSLLLSLGLISVVVALGSQTIISNLLGGVIVYLERPFHPGDIIKVGDNIGEVLGISYRTTALRGLNGLNIVVPNSTFLTVPIVNYSRSQSYLLKVPFVMPRKADASKLVDAVRPVISRLPGVRYDLDMNVYKLKITPDNIEYEFHVWVKDPRDSEMVASAVIDVINGLG